MRDLGLDALVKANRSVNTPGADVRERNRLRLLRRIAAGLVASGSATGAGIGAAGAAVTRVAAPTLAAPTLAAPTSALVSVSTAKWAIAAIVLAASGAAGLGAYHAHAGRVAEPAQSSAVVLAPPTAQPRALVALGAVPAAVIATAASEPNDHLEHSTRPDSPVKPVATRGARSLEPELELLRRARRAIDTGSPMQALSLLDRYTHEFPHGALKPECEAARVLALCSAGQIAAARRARDQFIQHHPSSPLSQRLRTICEGEP